MQTKEQEEIMFNFRERTTMSKINISSYSIVLIGVIALWIFTIANYPQYEDSLIVAPLLNMKSCISILYSAVLLYILILIGIKTLVNVCMDFKGCANKRKVIVSIIFHIVIFTMLGIVICLFIHINYGVEFPFISGIRA